MDISQKKTRKRIEIYHTAISLGIHLKDVIHVHNGVLPRKEK